MSTCSLQWINEVLVRGGFFGAEVVIDTVEHSDGVLVPLRILNVRGVVKSYQNLGISNYLDW